MIKYSKFKKLFRILEVILIILTLTALLCNPKINMQSFYDGIILWARFVLPALFPLIFLSSLLNYSGFVHKLGKLFTPITTKLFNCSGISGYVYIISILSGYPIGAKVTSELYESGSITSYEASKITSFSSTSGPLFILGTVGIGMFNDIKIGIIILISHLLGALVNGILWRNLYSKTRVQIYNSVPKEQNNILENCMLQSIKSILIIGGYIALSYMLLSIVSHYNLLLPITTVLNKIFNLDINLSTSIINGLIEITKGAKDLSNICMDRNLATILTTAIISMGGISIFLQAYTYLAKFKIKLKIYFAQKLTHTIVAVIICLIIISIFPI